MNYYVFFNQYGTVLYEGNHQSEYQAWDAFWDKCKYPQNARNKEECLRGGIECKNSL
jgi:hypothetical protein